MDAPSTEADLAITNVRLFDGTGSPALDGATVLVQRGRIAQVGPHDAVSIPPSTRVINASGKTLLPGLIDMHVHLEQDTFPLFLANGVTTVKDVGNRLERVVEWSRAERTGELDAPRVFFCGPLLEGDPPLWPDVALVLPDPASATAAVDRLADAGVNALKVYMRLTEEVLSPLLKCAHERELPVTAHLGRVPASHAIHLGLDGLEHAAQGLYWEVVPPDLRLHADERIRLGQAAFWAGFMQGWAAIDIQSDAVRRIINLLVERDVFIVATLATLDQRIGGQEDSTGPTGLEYLASSTTAEWDETVKWFTTGWTEEDYATAKQAVANIHALLGELHRSGGRIVAGTDAPFAEVVPGFSLHRELEMLVVSGLSPAEALYAATGGAALALRRQDDIGTVTVGKLADLVLIDGDPLADIRNTRQIRTVVKGGIVLDPEQFLAKAQH